MIQFEGLHLQFPDVKVYTWKDGRHEVSTSLKEAALGSTVDNYAILRDDKKISIGENKGEKPEVQYLYEKGKLIKQ
ncbi:hypothetical protein [Paenibacillus sp. N3.4]|uniref:hypothetical protein n=1 Tax=Paenibacillus sp. N3.4 TaxID=2603222 RepID=UPI0011C918CE|nr:hypothetical protein [Paenibacillus sp. N3.4]TXK76723.1 hypothetical protein FU659_24945 [Paenibacillus sp. N3.4]